MKSTSPILLVFLKEMREMLRDKRVRFSAFVAPIIVIFIIVGLIGTVAASIGEKAKQTIYVVRTDSPIVEYLRMSPRLNLQFVPTQQAGVNLIKAGKARLLLTIGQPAPDGQIQITEQYDPKEDTSEIAKSTVEASLKPFVEQYQTAKLGAVGLSRNQIQPLTYKDGPVQVGQSGASGFIVSFLPYLLVLFAFSGGINFAGDIVAGEKEKSTLETLLISPAPRTDIVLGKFFALCAICLASTLCSLIGLALAAEIRTGATSAIFAGGLGLTPRTACLLLVLILPLVGFFGGALIAVSSFAKNIREAQTYMGVLYMVVLLPAVFSEVLGLTDFGRSLWINLVPILNTAANIRTTFQGKPSGAGIGITFLVNLVLAAITLWIAVRLFNREQVLDRT